MSLATLIKQDTKSRMHYSEYLRTENKPGEGEKPAETTTTQPEPKEAE